MKNGVGADCASIEMFADVFGLTVTSDENGNILNIEMHITASSRFGALPIEVYQEIDTELRKKLKVIVTDYGKAACFYRQAIMLLVKAPKKE